MLGLQRGAHRKAKSEGEKPFWISFSDLMSALMVLFLVVECRAAGRDQEGLGGRSPGGAAHSRHHRSDGRDPEGGQAVRRWRIVGTTTILVHEATLSAKGKTNSLRRNELCSEFIKLITALPVPQGRRWFWRR
jgi:hypothetical protein